MSGAGRGSLFSLPSPFFTALSAARLSPIYLQISATGNQQDIDERANANPSHYCVPIRISKYTMVASYISFRRHSRLARPVFHSSRIVMRNRMNAMAA